MALHENPHTLLPGLFDRAVNGTIVQIQKFMDQYISKILKDNNDKAKLMWELSNEESAGTRHFEILRNGTVLCYGAVSGKEERVDQIKETEARRLNEEILVPNQRDSGYIFVTWNTGGSLKIEFAIVRHDDDDGNNPEVEPALGTIERSTVELCDGDLSLLSESVFREFLKMCTQFVPGRNQ